MTKVQNRPYARVISSWLYFRPLPVQVLGLLAWDQHGILISALVSALLNCVTGQHNILFNLFVDGFTRSLRCKAYFRGTKMVVL